MKFIDFWFDPISPYAYLAFERMPEVFEGLTYSVTYRPVLFEEYSLHEGSGGAGEHRGGFGVNYRIRLRRGDARVSMVMDHGRAGPPGAQGGGAGGVNKVKIIRDGVEYVPAHLSKDQDIEIHAGDVISVSTPGGGGFGEPSRRPTADRTRDVALGYYSAEESQRLFGTPA